MTELYRPKQQEIDDNKDIPVLGPWSAWETIVLNAQTTIPTKGASVPIDRVRWRQVGEDYEVEYQFYQDSIGTVGNGEYIIQLPESVRFHPDQFFVTGNLASGISDNDMPANVGNGSIGDGTTGGYGFAFASSESNFRMVWRSETTDSYIAWSHTYYDFNATFGFNIKLKFKGKDLVATKKFSEL